MNLHNLKSFFLNNKKVIIPAVIVIFAIFYFVFHSNKPNTANIYTVGYMDLVRSVRATGQVISSTDLDLSFNKGGTVKSVRVAVGDKAKSGQILATLDQGQVYAQLTEARAALLGSQARYNKTLEGASNEDIALAKVGLKNTETDFANTKTSQDVLVSNAYQTLLNSSLAAFSSSPSSIESSPSVSGTYVLGREGDIKLSLNQGGSGTYFNATGLVNATGTVSTATPQPIGDSGLFILFPVNYSTTSNWIISIPNKKASNYLTNYNAYKIALQSQSNAVSSAQSIVDQKQAELNLKQAAARGTDLDIAKADILSKQGALQSAQVAYEDTIIRAPVSGTITKVNLKYGEISESGKGVITLEDVGNLYIEALINESNIAYLSAAQSAEIIFDAFGNDKKFTGSIVHIDPSADTTNGVVNYKMKVSIDGKSGIIRPGMNANINIIAGETRNVLAVPNASLAKKSEKSFVKVLIDEKNNKYQDREIKTGFLGDNNMIEVTSGLSNGEKIELVQN